MNVRLVLERKHKRVWSTQMRGPEATLGRAVGCTIRIPSAEVSRLHCRLRVEDGLVTVEDLESVNGTFINSVRVRGIETVRPGDRLSLGSVTFVVEYKLSPEVLRRLSSGEDVSVLEAIDEAPSMAATVPPVAEPLPLVEPVDEAEEGGAEMFVLDEENEVNLPEGGDLRDFLLELDDDTEDRPKKARS